ncbi:DMT family transporter [Lysinibacillus sp. fkY74-1]|uniref:EamA family transporter n=1 Tax=Lysinibacillus TaxID=400634 RepID=UPI00055C5166|nr:MULTISPECIES: DMT family transporter [Lysinibacillus]MBG9689734.1 multidrug transporter [Lysinibacillus sphaericus]MBG9757146.1 multidrug transporter [Lysinibacillus sphaericus]MBI6865778.1 DMT family transporter [Lysinibacillus fusiformis]MDM5349634.1 DMT family transporter [Lysinibacillus sphaericus]MEB7453275.1 DMT family transporter [Lysinibacillus sphaericus]
MNKLKFSLVVLLGACSYGVLSSILKVGFSNGYTFPQLLGGQYVFGWFGLLILVLTFSRYKVSLKNIVSLLAVGTTMSLTSIFYGFSVKELPASIAIVLLFQFTWMGVLIEAIINKSFPSREKVLSIIILFVGTMLAGGVFEGLGQQLSLKGILFGLLAAITFSFYIFASGRVSTEVPIYSKSFLMTTSATLFVCIMFPPTYLMDGTLQAGLWKYALILGFFGVVIPVICFSIGIPKVGTGLGTILGAVELPTAVIASITLVHEVVSLLQWLGIVCILLGIFIPQMLNVRKERQLARFSNEATEF